MEKKKIDYRRQLTLFLYLWGALGLVFAGIHLLPVFSSGSDTLPYDVAMNAGSGLLGLLAGWLVAKGRRIAVAFIVASILVSMVYYYLVGRGFDFLTIILGVFFMYWAIKLWKQEELV